jgi:hypothetical protein
MRWGIIFLFTSGTLALLIKVKLMIVPRKAILNLNNADELTTWGKARAANIQPVTVSQQTTFFGDRTPQDNVGVYNLASTPATPQPQAYVNTGKLKTDGVDRFYKDTAFGWGQPRTAGSVTPMLNADVESPFYSPKTLAANNIAIVDGTPRKVRWIKPPGADESARVPWVKVGDDEFPLTGEARAIFDRHGNKPISERQRDGRFKTINEDKFVYPVDNSNWPRKRDTQNLGQELAEVNRKIMESGNNPYDPYAPPNLRDVYTGSPDEAGLQAFQQQVQVGVDALGLPIYQYVHRGNSGTWINDNQEEVLNLFAANKQSQGQSMVAEDMRRGGYRQNGGRIASAYPAADEADFIGGRIGYNSLGVPFDIDRRLVQRLGPVAPEGNVEYVAVELNNRIHPAVIAFTPASEFLQSTPQITKDLRTGAVLRGQVNPIVRPPTYTETPLSRVTVNEYGQVVAQSLPSGRLARSVMLRNGTLPIDNKEMVFRPDGNDPIIIKGKPQYTGTWARNSLYGKPEMSSAGRWIGGSMTDAEVAKGFNSGYRSGKISDRDPLDSNYQIRGNYRAVLSPNDERVIAAQQADAEARNLAAQVQETFTPPFTRNFTITQTGREIPASFEENQIQGAYLPVTYEGSKGVNVPGYAPYVPTAASAQEQIAEGLTRLDQYLADVRVEIDGRKYPLTPEATTKPYIPSDTQRSAESVARYGRVRVDRDGDIWDIDGPSDDEILAIARKGTNNFSPGQDIANARARGVGLSDGSEVYANPDIDVMDADSAIAEAKRKLNRIKAGINNYYTSPTARIPQSGMGTDGVFTINPGDPQLVQVPYANRFIDEAEAARIQAANEASRVARLKTVRDIDGTEYVEDMSHVSKRDIANLFNEGQDYSVLPGYLESEINKAQGTVNQLMGLEAQPEVKISIPGTGPKAVTLGEQARQLGMDVLHDTDYDQTDITGLIPYGSNLNLPVKYNAVQEEVDPEIAAMVLQANADKQAAQNLIDVATAYRQQERMNQIGYPSKPQVINETQAAAIQERVIKKAALQAMADRQAGYFGDELAQMLSAPTPNTAAQQAYDIMFDQGNVRKRTANRRWAEQVAIPEPPPSKDPRFVEDYGNMYRGGRLHEYFVNPGLTPVDNYTVYRTVDDVVQRPSIQTEVRRRIAESMQEPQYVTYQDLQSPTPNPQHPIPNSHSPVPSPRFDPRQLPSWTIPAGIGGVWLGAAGINAYQQEQERRRQNEEMELRRMYAGV